MSHVFVEKVCFNLLQLFKTLYGFPPRRHIDLESEGIMNFSSTGILTKNSWSEFLLEPFAA